MPAASGRTCSANCRVSSICWVVRLRRLSMSAMTVTARPRTASSSSSSSSTRACFSDSCPCTDPLPCSYPQPVLVATCTHIERKSTPSGSFVEVSVPSQHGQREWWCGIWACGRGASGWYTVRCDKLAEGYRQCFVCQAADGMGESGANVWTLSALH